MRRTVVHLTFVAAFCASAWAQNAGVPVIVLIGPPGAGKSTQADRIQKKYGFALITREQLMQDDPALLARSKQPEIDGVEPRVDPALNELFARRLENTDISKGLLLDGYPAAKDHADFLAKIISEKNLAAPVVLQMNVPDSTVRERLKGESSATIDQNLKDYHREMDFVSVYFPRAAIIPINGDAKPDAVFKQIEKAIDQRVKK